MGLIKSKIILKNPQNLNLKSIQVEALVDTGALHLCIPEHIAIQLKLKENSQREVSIADGSRKICPYVGPIQVEYESRTCFTGALVIGDEILLGAVPMEDMDLIVSPAKQTLRVNPESPNIPSSKIK